VLELERVLAPVVVNFWLADLVEVGKLPANSLVPLEIVIEDDSDVEDVPRFPVLTRDDTPDAVAVLVKLELPERIARVFVVADALDTLSDVVIAPAVLL
jgi:hypothetical protein